eukprot:TRINITY_DN12599_c1_g4_i1.p2 TRINITY_DN12599_c1_g4~~TRINITY_DN12599_c1_g4_i1.p2  ORF type:complete len:143 (+),score=10.86 TRINITY_DN12599_c1_g4_i1:437-865(+)
MRLSSWASGGTRDPSPDSDDATRRANGYTKRYSNLGEKCGSTLHPYPRMSRVSSPGGTRSAARPSSPPYRLGMADSMYRTALSSMALCPDYNGDNAGIKSIGDTNADWHQLAQEFHNAVIQSSTFDCFFKETRGFTAFRATL